MVIFGELILKTMNSEMKLLLHSNYVFFFKFELKENVKFLQVLTSKLFVSPFRL